MTWLFYILVASMIWGALNIFDKIVITKYIKSPENNIILGAIFRIFFLPILFVLFPVTFNSQWIIPAMVIGALQIISGIFYFRAMQIEEASKVIPLTYLHPILTLVLATIFLGESFVLEQYVGIFLIVASAILISVNKVEGLWKASPAMKSIIILVCIFSLRATAGKYVLEYMDYVSFTLWSAMGGMFGGLPFLLPKNSWKSFMGEISTLNKKTLLLIFFSFVVFFVAIFLYNGAVSLAPVSLVSAVGSIRPLFVLIYATLLTMFAPRIFEEKISKSTILLKLLSILLLMAGMFLITS